MKALTSSKDQIQDCYDMMNNFFNNQEEMQEEYERRQSTIRESRKEEERKNREVQYGEVVKNVLGVFFCGNQGLELADLKIGSN